MNRLWIFGDSFSEPFSKENIIWKKEYSQYKGYIPDYYGQIVAKEFDLLHITNAEGGIDNYSILDCIIHNLNKIKPSDFIIIGWANTLRWRIATDNNQFSTIRINSNKLNNYSDIQYNTLLEISANRDNIAYINELNNYIKLINFAFPSNKIIHWSPYCENLIGDNIVNFSNNDFETIYSETNGSIEDKHYTENSHKFLANTFISYFNSNKIKNKNNII